MRRITRLHWERAQNGHSPPRVLIASFRSVVSGLKQGARCRYYSRQSATCLLTRSVCLQGTWDLALWPWPLQAATWAPGSGPTRRELLGLGGGELSGIARSCWEAAPLSTSSPRFCGSTGDSELQRWTAVFSLSLLEIKNPERREVSAPVRAHPRTGLGSPGLTRDLARRASRARSSITATLHKANTCLIYCIKPWWLHLQFN